MQIWKYQVNGFQLTHQDPIKCINKFEKASNHAFSWSMAGFEAYFFPYLNSQTKKDLKEAEFSTLELIATSKEIPLFLILLLHWK